MTTFADAPVTRPGWLSRAEAWMDARGRAAWIIAMVLGFIAFWPIGLAVLGYMLMTSKFTKGACSMRRNLPGRPSFTRPASSGNSAFDAYRAETLRRLEEEQTAFDAFLKRLREAKDKAEFDQFMDERARRAERDDRDEGPAET